MNVYQTLTDTAQKFGAKPALVFKEQQINFADLKQRVFELALGLKALGAVQGTKIGLYLPNAPEYVYGYLSALMLGMVVVPLDYMLKSDELISCLSHAQTQYLIASFKPDIDWDVLKKNIPSLKKIIFLGPDFDSLLQSGDLKQEPISEIHPALIMYTSGTTGQPKGILLNHKHLQGSPDAMKYFVDLTARDTKLCAIPLSHIGGFIYIQNCLIFGITLVLMDRFHPLEFLRNIQQYKVTCFHIVPPMYTAMLTVKNIDQFDLSSLRWVVVFGAPNAPDILERFHKYCPNARLLNGWGMTETCPPNTVTPLDNPRIESVGKPAPHCRIQIVDAQDNVLPTGEVGEIVIQGWIVFDAYYQDPEATAKAKQGGWFHTGDLGRFDNEGLLYIVGRKKEMIKVAGQIVYAPEVESALCRHEAVLEAAVIGVPDAMRGEAVKAFVVLKEGYSVDGLEIKYYLREHLANFKVPQTVEIVAVIVKNRTGKIDKESLKQEVLVQERV